MYNASLIADILVRRGIQEGYFLTQMKLQKMLYFANGYYLARYGEPLIKEPFQAWKFGPVLPGIYQDYKLYGNKPILDTELSGYTQSSRSNYDKLDEAAREAIEYTWEATKDISALSLSKWTHEPGSPWSKSYNELDWGTVIDNDAIRQYFKQFLANGNP